ncbi:MAG: RNA polymerase sigma factor [Chthonomonas sp.]|nr:RNA polymerase sigma factor [Chthonomonas sp.]
MKQNTCATEGEITLILRAKAGNRAAFDTLIELHRTRLYRAAFRKLRNTEDSQDMVQETTMRAYRAIQTYDAARPIGPWLQRICMNCCIDLIRDRKLRVEQLDAHEYNLRDESQDPEQQTALLDLCATVDGALDRIPHRYAEILRLRHFDDLDVLEIAARMGKPEGTIKSWLFRARALLRKELPTAIVRA